MKSITINKILSSFSFQLILIIGFLLLNAIILFSYPLLSLTFGFGITALSVIIYKRGIPLPEKNSYLSWIIYCFCFIICLAFIFLVKRQEIINSFGDLFVDGKVEDVYRISEGPDGGDFSEYVSVFIPNSKKGARLISTFELSIWAVGALLIFINYKLFTYESKKTDSPFWYISELSNHFEKYHIWTNQDLPKNIISPIENYYDSLDEKANWQLRQKINFQMTLLRIRHFKEKEELPDTWTENDNTCIQLAEYVIIQTVFQLDGFFSKAKQDTKRLKFEKLLIVKSLAYYISALKKGYVVISNNSKRNGLISNLTTLFYYIQDNFYSAVEKQTRSLSTILKEDVFPPVTTIIIVDDHKLFRMGVKNYLSKNKSLTFIHEAENGQELIVLLDHSTADVISLGIQMPVMDGLKFLERFNYQEEPKIVSLSFLNDPKVVLRALKLGASSYLDKSQGGEIITKAYKQTHAYGFYYSSIIRETINRLNES